MDDIVCEICLKDYSNDVIVPRVLNCGHTICTSCITQILQTSGSCFKCRMALTCDCSSDYPINYYLLGMVDSLKKATSQTLLQRRQNTLKRISVSLDNKLKEAKVNLENNLDVITASLTSIQELKIDESIDVDACYLTILTHSKQLEDLCKVNTLNYAKLKSSTTLNCCDFDEPIKFIHEIYKQVSNKEIFYAVTKINDETKFSQISVWGNKLILHAFGPPVEDPLIKTVWLQEIKNCLTTDNVRALLEISCNDSGIRQIIVIKTINSSLVPQFLKYCTGEIGPVYKGAIYSEGSISHISRHVSPVLTVDKCNVNGVKENGNFEYIASLDTNVTCNKGDLVVIGKRNVGFQIVQIMNDVSITDVIGKIEEPLQLRRMITHGNDRKVIDSGIVILL